jgi:hypothetical protein
MSDAEFSPWKGRFDSVVERMKQGGEWEIDRVIARVDTPDNASFIAEMAARIEKGALVASYRVWSADGSRVLLESPYDRILPASVYDPLASGLVSFGWKNVTLSLRTPQSKDSTQ